MGRLLFLVSAFFLFGSLALAADQNVAVDAFPDLNQGKKKFVESYDEKVNVSAGLSLVGLRLGTTTGLLDPENVFIAHPFRSGPLKICVDATTQDGRYSAHNPYTVQPPATPSNLIRLQPLTSKI